MPKREAFYGKDAWMDPKFDLVAATAWLRLIDENDPLLFQMLERATNGEYESINKTITGFIVAVYRSKHSENDSVTSYLFKNLRDDLLESLAFEKIPPDGLKLITKNSRLVNSPGLMARVSRILKRREKTTF